VELIDLGWDAAWEAAFEPHAQAGCRPARVITEHRGELELAAAGGPVRAGLAGRMRHAAVDARGLPAVGDWVAFTGAPGTATVRALLPRRSVFVRLAAGAETLPQVLAANVDVVLVAMALDADYSLERLQRYLTLAWESGAQPQIVLTKADLCADVEAATGAVSAAVYGVPVTVTEARRPETFRPVAALFSGGRTGVVLGSSGVGKSTMINHLLGESRQAVAAIAADGTGRHTTTARHLLAVPGGGCVIDTPGLREVQLWGTGDGVEAAFEDVELLAAECRFRDCAHESEPGCAVKAAIASGGLDCERLTSYRKLQRELRHLELKNDARGRALERKRWAQINKDARTTSW
jgi:ribosome biogenesis GTPase